MVHSRMAGRLHGPVDVATLIAGVDDQTLHSLTPADWSKKQYVWERDASVLDVVTWHANHDIGHIAQIRRLVAMC